MQAGSLHITDRPNDTRAVGSTKLQADLGTFQGFQRIPQVAAVERDLPSVTLHTRLELADVIPHFGTCGLDEYLAEGGCAIVGGWRALQAHNIGVITCEHRGGAVARRRSAVLRMTVVVLLRGMMRS